MYVLRQYLVLRIPTHQTKHYFFSRPSGNTIPEKRRRHRKRIFLLSIVVMKGNTKLVALPRFRIPSSDAHYCMQPKGRQRRSLRCSEGGCYLRYLYCFQLFLTCPPRIKDLVDAPTTSGENRRAVLRRLKDVDPALRVAMLKLAWLERAAGPIKEGASSRRMFRC